MAWLTRLCFIPNLCISLILATSNLSAAVSSSWATRDKCNVFNVFCLYKDFLFEIQQEHKSSGYYRDWGRKKKKKEGGKPSISPLLQHCQYLSEKALWIVSALPAGLHSCCGSTLRSQHHSVTLFQADSGGQMSPTKSSTQVSQASAFSFGDLTFQCSTGLILLEVVNTFLWSA